MARVKGSRRGPGPSKKGITQPCTVLILRGIKMVFKMISCDGIYWVHVLGHAPPLDWKWHSDLLWAQRMSDVRDLTSEVSDKVQPILLLLFLLSSLWLIWLILAALWKVSKDHRWLSSHLQGRSAFSLSVGATSYLRELNAFHTRVFSSPTP